MATIDLGKVSITPRGTWDAATTYEPLDVVLYGGSSYIALAETVGNPPTDARYFSLLAAKGDPGENANVNKENIEAALGYTAADARSLAALWKLSQGIVYDFETDATAAYTKTVPTGAKGCTVKSIGGNSVVWNQFTDKSKFGATQTVNGITFTNNGDGSIAINGTATEKATFRLCNSWVIEDVPVISGHKYLINSCEGLHRNIAFKDDAENFAFNLLLQITSIKEASFDANTHYDVLIVESGTTVNTVFTPFIIDLTAIFGYGNEPIAIDDPRIAWVEQYAEEHADYNAGAIISADVESVVYGTADTEIPSAIRALDGYGWSVGDVCNEVDYANKKYIRRVGKVVIDGVNNKVSSRYVFPAYPDIARFLFAGASNTELYKPLSSYVCDRFIQKDKYLYGMCNTTDQNLNRMWFFLPSGIETDDAANAWFAENPTTVFYELAEEVVQDISNLIGDTLQAPFAVEAGGTITFRNSALLAVPSDVEYVIKLSEVNAS